MSSEFVKEIMRNYEKKRNKALADQKTRIQEVYNRVPRIKEINEDISKTGILISKEILKNPDNFQDKVDEIKGKMEELKREKAFLLTENNIPLEYMDINYECNRCNDTGFLENGTKCNCFKQALINNAYQMSNLQHMLKKENFGTFDITIFSNESLEDIELTPRQNMMKILNVSEGFCLNFDSNNEENLLFYGTTGLGKTFMCNCIAKALLDKGKIVVYQTAFKILELIANHKFNKGTPISEEQYNQLFNADLLIIDDLGTELTNSFTNSELFNIVNSRLIKGSKTIISTNLDPAELFNIYTERVFSRIFNKFTPLEFYGPDLRYQ